MNPANRDLFESWRLLLVTVCTIYTAIVCLRSAWHWTLYLTGSDRRSTMLRRYATVQLLRLRIRRFSGELTRIALLLVVLAGLLCVHP